MVIEDSRDGASINEVIDLAMAHVELAPPRSVTLLAAARELAVDAAAVNDFTAVIDQCHRASMRSPTSPRSCASALATLASWACNRRGELSAATGDEHAAFEDFQERFGCSPTRGKRSQPRRNVSTLCQADGSSGGLQPRQ